MADFVGHAPCGNCGSKDNRAMYADGSSFCFGCSAYTGGEGKSEQKKPKDLQHHEFIYSAITSRKLSKETCKTYGYMVGNYKGALLHCEVYRNKENHIVAHKYRTPDKDFIWEGKAKEAILFGQHLFTPNKNISITITEGAIDALSIAEIQECRWPVVSLKGGAQSAKKEIQEQMEWLLGFKEVRLCFDSDEHGKKAALECAALFKSGFCKLITLPMKDANEMLLANKVKELSTAMMNAKVHRPDHVVNSSDINWDDVLKPIAKGWSIPYTYLNSMIRGILPRRLYLLSAGFGCGKTTIMKEIALHLRLQHGLKVGVIHLEEGFQESVLSFICMDNNLPINTILEDPSQIGTENYMRSRKRLYDDGKFIFYKHFGSDDVDNLMSKIEYFAVSEECDIILFDHVTAAVSGIKGGQEGDRKTIDYLMDGLRSLIQRTGVTIIAAAQLVKGANGKSFNNGAEITISDLRGSGQLAGVPDVIFGIEGDQQGTDPNARTIRVLKNRITGKVGVADELLYNDATGRLQARTIVHIGEVPF